MRSASTRRRRSARRRGARRLRHAGRRHAENTQQHQGARSGFDVRTGKKLWQFNTIPSPGEFGNETWENDSWAINGNVGVWNQMAVDEELGLAYLPVETPTSDFYGGHRPGNNLFAESLVALDCKTGKRKWHFQLVHHPLWNMDIAAAPVLADIVVNGRPVKAVAIMGKQAILYVFDRVTGQPMFPIEERPVAKGDVPGERTSPTQPFPTKPPPYNHQGVTLDNLIDFTPELRAEALDRARYKLGPIFTPPPVSRVEGPSPRSDRRVERIGPAAPPIRKRTSVRPVVYLAAGDRSDAAAKPRVFRHPLRAGERADRRTLHRGSGRKRWRGRGAARASVAAVDEGSRGGGPGDGGNRHRKACHC